MAAIGSMRKKLTGFNDEGDDDYGSAGMYFNPSMFPPHRPEKEVGTFISCTVEVMRRYCIYVLSMLNYQERCILSVCDTGIF